MSPQLAAQNVQGGYKQQNELNKIGGKIGGGFFEANTITTPAGNSNDIQNQLSSLRTLNQIKVQGAQDTLSNGNPLLVKGGKRNRKSRKSRKHKKSKKLKKSRKSRRSKSRK